MGVRRGFGSVCQRPMLYDSPSVQALQFYLHKDSFPSVRRSFSTYASIILMRAYGRPIIGVSNAQVKNIDPHMYNALPDLPQLEQVLVA